MPARALCSIIEIPQRLRGKLRQQQAAILRRSQARKAGLQFGLRRLLSRLGQRTAGLVELGTGEHCHRMACCHEHARHHAHMGPATSIHAALFMGSKHTPSVRACWGDKDTACNSAAMPAAGSASAPASCH